MDDIQRFVLDRVEAAKTVLEKEILFGHIFEEFGYTCAKIMDVLWNTQIGYSFIDSQDNGFIKFKDKLMETLLNDPNVIFCAKYEDRSKIRVLLVTKFSHWFQ